MNENNIALADIQKRIDDEIGCAVDTIHYTINDNGHYCCRLCHETIRDINYMYVYIQENHIDRDIVTLVFGDNCLNG
jgi:hypothetical protein